MIIFFNRRQLITSEQVDSSFWLKYNLEGKRKMAMKIDSSFLSKISLAGKTALISGGASGIGLACARIFAQAGAQVVLFDKDKAKGQKALQEFNTSPPSIIFIPGDVTSAADCQAAADEAQKITGNIDILVNNAGVIIRKSILETSEKEWNEVVEVSLKGTFLLSRAVIPVMKAYGGGAIINIGSGWGLKGGPQAAAYCAAKGGIVNLTRAMAIDHGPDNIRVNCLCPGDVDTPLLRQEAQQLGVDESRFLHEAAARPLARIGQPEDIALAALFLASNLSPWITGAVLVVDGGGLA